MNMTASDHFEDRLLAQLRDIVAAQPTPSSPRRQRRTGRTRLALAGAAVTAAVTAVAIVASSGDVTPSAYAVQSQPGGEVTVSINSLKDASGLESSLRAAGIPAIVSYVPASEVGCLGAPPPKSADGSGSVRGSLQRIEKTAGGSGAGPSFSTEAPETRAAPAGAAAEKLGGPGAGLKMGSKVSVNSAGAATFSIDPGTLKPGEKLYISTSTGTVSSIGMMISQDGPPQACGGHDPAP
jgi:hypothetical protein